VKYVLAEKLFTLHWSWDFKLCCLNQWSVLNLISFSKDVFSTLTGDQTFFRFFYRPEKERLIQFLAESSAAPYMSTESSQCHQISVSQVRIYWKSHRSWELTRTVSKLRLFRKREVLSAECEAEKKKNNKIKFTFRKVHF